ncbi:MAG: hypothetical protein ABIP57_06480 [Jatrophihabitantaceae bacterium]
MSSCRREIDFNETFQRFGLYLIVVSIVVGISACSSNGKSTAIKSVSTTSSTSASTASTSASTASAAATSASVASSSATPQSAVLGPEGLRALKLGMTRVQALRTGEITISTLPASALAPGCIGFDLTANRMPRPNRVDGYISAKYGVVAIWAPAGVRTPQGVGVGSTLAAVKRAYPTIDVTKTINGGPTVRTPGNPQAFYQLPYGAGDKVTSLSLLSQSQDCFN